MKTQIYATPAVKGLMHPKDVFFLLAHQHIIIISTHYISGYIVKRAKCTKACVEPLYLVILTSIFTKTIAFSCLSLFAIMILETMGILIFFFFWCKISLK